MIMVMGMIMVLTEVMTLDDVDDRSNMQYDACI